MVDEHTDLTIGVRFGSDAGRSVLGAIASGMITFTGFVCSILLLAVQFGSSQFSPRMLRRFLRAPTTKAALGAFMATFVYALMVLRLVGTGDDADFVPHTSISIALILLLLSMLLFLRLISKTTQGLRVAAVVSDLSRDAARVIDRAYPEPARDPDGDGAGDGMGDQDETPRPSGPARTVVYRGRPGIVQSFDIRRLVERAGRHDAVIELLPRAGDLIATGFPLFRVYADPQSSIDDTWLRGTVATGDERTMRQDPAFAFRLLADISAKALSPGVNDPTTSTQAMDQIELLLRQVGGRRLTSAGVAPDGTVRLRYRGPSWEDLLSLAVDETRRYGEGSIQVMRRLRALLINVHQAVPAFRRPPVEERISLLEAAAQRAFPDRSDQLEAITSDRQGLGAADRHA
jgi:uncharacterized membrane protein